MTVKLPFTHGRARPAAVVAGVVLAFGSLFVGSLIDRSPNVGGDAWVLVYGARVVVDCLEAGTLSRCGTSAADRAHEPVPFKSAVADFPPLQYLIVIPLAFAGMGTNHMYTALALVSIVAFVLTGMLLVVVARRARQHDVVPLLLLVLLASPMLYYANSTFGEMLASFFLVGAVASVVLRARPSLIALATCAATITKETAFVFVVALGLWTVWRQPAPNRRLRAAAVVYGGLLGVFVLALFNYFRYGSLLNQDLINPVLRVPTFGLRANFFAALVGSPNGGILEYWPAAALLFAGVAGLGAFRQRGRESKLAAVLLIVLFAVLLVGLADWWTPFGWYAWGPRLTLPWMLPFCLAAVVTFPTEARRLQQFAFGSKMRAAVVTAVVLVAALPQIGVGFYTQAAGLLFVTDKWCPTGLNPGTQAYYACVKHQAWAHSPVAFEALRGIWTKDGLLVSLAFTATIVLLAIHAHLNVTGQPNGRTRLPVWSEHEEHAFSS